jgi:predicted nucleic acid-binding protein
MVTIVSDTGPLITWARAKQIPLLKKIFAEIWVPPAVALELKSPDSRPGANLVDEFWVREKPLAPPGRALLLPPKLGPGEREAILLALRLDMALLIDDKAGKNAAHEAGLQVLTTLRVLRQCKSLKLVERVGPILEMMCAEGFWLAPEVRQSFLKELDE